MEEKITWKMLVKAQPELKALLKKARAIRDDGIDPSFCANYHWYKRPDGLREEVYRLVGWEADPALPAFVRTSAAFDLVYHKVYNVLPGCRNCICYDRSDLS